LLRRVKTRSASSAGADRRAQGEPRIRMMWRKAIT
jgi:hypothetical protein